jgi:hypothetical protein
MQQRGFLVKAARFCSEAAALSVPLRGLIRTPGCAERGQRHENRRRRLKPAPAAFVRIGISHLTESFKNVGAASSQDVIIRTFSKRQFATRAQRPFTTRPKPRPNSDLNVELNPPWVWNPRHVPAAMSRIRIDAFECLGFMFSFCRSLFWRNRLVGSYREVCSGLERGLSQHFTRPQIPIQVYGVLAES